MMPVKEKRKKLKAIYIIYIIIAIICIIAIGYAVYMQYFKDEKLGVIFGITDEENDEEMTEIKENFMNIFDNSINILENTDVEINKIEENSDLIVVKYENDEKKDNYSLNVKIPYFNVNSSITKNFNNEIKTTFKDKTKSVIETSSEDENIIYTVKYTAYLYKNIMSLIILSELKENNSNQRIIVQTYNYNIAEDRVATIDDILKIKEIDEKTADNKIEKEIKSSQEQNVKLAELGYKANIRDWASDFYNIENATEFFIGDNNYLYIVYAYGNTEFTSEMDLVVFK